MATAKTVIYKKGYTDGQYGQMHYHFGWPANQQTSQPALVLLHQSPKSAFEYRHLIRSLATNRPVIAFDTPGYGQSDGPDTPLLMPELAAAIVFSIKQFMQEKELAAPIDLFGFHTGASIATCIAIEEPDLIGRVLLSGLPYFSSDYYQTRFAELSHEVEIDQDGEFIHDRWCKVVQNRAQGVSILEAAKSFVQDITSLNKMHFAYFAAYSYDLNEHLPEIQQPILVLAPHELLIKETLCAHQEAIPHATLIELPDVIDDVFDTGWREIAAAIQGWLTQNQATQ